ncbi:hypothetical protein DV735_g3350, partial [Chaetothyriales sp. CBS 134920]
MSNDNLAIPAFEFTDPSTLTPLFTAEWMTCAYPVSDLYGSTPRYLYYVLLVLVFLTQWHSWLANVFLGVVSAYAGTAAIEAFILISNMPHVAAPEAVSIPYIAPSSVPGNATLSSIPNLITNHTRVQVQPAALEFDIDAVLAITVTGYLVMLPMHCWSSAVRANRARHVLVLLWNALMFAGMLCSIIMWPSLFNNGLQYRFCYPTILDSNSVSSDGHYHDEFSQFDGTWNATIWNIFSNFSRAANLNQNCFYPCFNTSQIMRRPNSLVADLSSRRSLRVNKQALEAGGASSNMHNSREEDLTSGMYIALIITTIIMVFLLLFVLTPLRKITRVPLAKPKDLLFSKRKELLRAMRQDFSRGIASLRSAIRHPCSTLHKIHHTPQRRALINVWKATRFFLDVMALVLLFIAMVITPAVIVIFVVFIEWYIHHDLESQEAPWQVGQWSTLASIALVLVSALVLRLRYVIATRNELEAELAETHTKAERLEALLKKMEEQQDKPETRPDTDTGTIGDTPSVELRPMDYT